MPFFHDQDRSGLRRLYVEAWRKHRAGRPLEPLEHQIVTVIEQHPEYHALLEDEAEALGRDFTPEAGQSNPFLHMGLHLAIREQAATDRPAGIAAIRTQLAERLANLGCQLCVSDVHSGNNPIPELLHLRPQFARIAEALAPALGDTDGTNTLLKPLIESLHREQIASIMPRVEGAGVLAVLWQLGVNFIQGDYLQAPQPQMHYDFTDLA